MLPGFSDTQQESLRNCTVLIVGAGGLGCPILQYLVAAGVGTIKIVDHDKVDLSNLQRQILFREEDLGQNKAISAVNRIQNLNSTCTLLPYPLAISSNNALELMEGVDLIIDASDNFPTRYLLSDLGELTAKPVVFGAVHQFEGQLSVFNYLDPKTGHRSPSYRDLYPSPPTPELIPDCSQAGVIGVLPGLVGLMQANEVIKIACELGDVLSSRLLIYDALSARSRQIAYSKNSSREKVEALIDYEEFCGLRKAANLSNTIDAEELLLALQQNDCLLIDIRKSSERHLVHIGGVHVPMESLNDYLAKQDTGKPIVLYCKTGRRSMDALLGAGELYPKLNIRSLEGGLVSYIKKHDLDLPVY